MKIKEVLNADWTVEWIQVTVRSEKGEFKPCTYMIGEKVKPSKYAKFVCETTLGDIYREGIMKIVVSERIIQHRHLTEKKKGSEMCVGVVEKNIPKEILEMEIDHMTPSALGHSSGMHGYYFDCYPDQWCGLPGEFEQIEMEL